VHLAPFPAEVDAAYRVSVEVIGDLDTALTEIADRAAPSQVGRPRAIREALLAAVEEGCGDASFPVKPQRLLYDLRAAMAPEDILISDVGAHKLWIARLYPCERPNTCIISNGLQPWGSPYPEPWRPNYSIPRERLLRPLGMGAF